MKIGAWQTFVIYVLFILGSVSTVGGTSEAGRDAWLVFLLGGILAIPLNMMYIKLVYSENPKNGAGRFVRKAIMVLIGIAAVHIGAIALALFTMFISQMTLVVTPDIIIAVFIALTAYVMCRGGISVLGRTAEMVFPVVIAFITVASIASMGQADFTNIVPMVKNGPAPLINGTFSALMFYFAEGFICVFTLCISADKNDAKKGILWGTVFTTLFVTAIFVRNLVVLGYPFVESLYFPSYTVASIITLSNFFQRMEVLISIVFILCKLIKLALAVEFVKRTFSHITRRDISYGIVTAIILNLSLILFKGIVDAFIWLQIYRYYLIIPCIIAPLIQLLTGMKKRKNKSP